VTNAHGELLKPVALFASLDSGAMRDVSEAARVKQMEAGDLFFREGDPAESFYVVQTGSVKLTQLTPEGHQVVMPRSCGC
jgi:CRP-like cAMP-binding protein